MTEIQWNDLVTVVAGNSPENIPVFFNPVIRQTAVQPADPQPHHIF